MGPSDRFTEVLLPAAPGTCRVCGVSWGTPGRKFYDTGLNSDFCNLPHWDPDDGLDHSVDQSTMGVVYFCDQCAIALGQAAGCLPPSLYEQLKKDLQDYMTLADNRASTIVGLESIINGYKIIDSVPSSSSDNFRNDPVLAEQKLEDFDEQFLDSIINDTPGSSSSSDDEQRVDSGNSETDESVSNEGSSNIPTSADDESRGTTDESEYDSVLSEPNVEEAGTGPIKF